MHFAEKGNWEEYNEVVIKTNVKKNILIPWDEVANICYDYGGAK